MVKQVQPFLASSAALTADATQVLIDQRFVGLGGTDRLSKILIKARDTLADPLKERFTDDRLIRLASDAQRLIALHANTLRSVSDVPLFLNHSTHALPPDIQQATRVLNEANQPILMLSYEQADKLYGLNWELATGSPMQALVFNHHEQGEARVYPMPVTVANTAAEVAVLNQLYGITVAGGLDSTYDMLSDPFGFISGVTQFISDTFTLYYQRLPVELALITDNIETSEAYDLAIKFYVTGMALRDDKDVQNRTLGNEELQFFQAELIKAKKDAQKDFSSNGNQHHTKYNGGFGV